MNGKINDLLAPGNVARFPSLYDLLHSDNLSDVPLYQRLSKGSDPVLECGIGTGRVAIPLARDGIVVHGIDNSPEMLAALQEKLNSEPANVRARVHSYQLDMCSFALGESFKLIYVPFMSFNYLLGITAQLACLHSIRAHLTDNGSLVMELMSFYREWFHNDGIPRFIVRRTDPHTRKSTEVFRVTRFDPSTQIVEHDRHYRSLSPEGHIEEERVVFLRNRFVTLGEASLLLEKAHFSLDHVWGDHNGGPYTKESQVMILAASKTAA
jgi:SAM-dependent methyltransferase